MSLARELESIQATVRGLRSPDQIRLLEQGVEWLRMSGVIGAAVRCGELVPEFDLPDVHGRRVSLADLLDRGPLVITFCCGSWCALCCTAVRAYRRALHSNAPDGDTLVAITLERAEAAATFSEAEDGAFHVISDANGRISKLYGVLYALPSPLVRLHRDLGIDLPTLNDSRRWERAVPATYVVNDAGIAVLAFLDADHARRAEPEDLLAALARLRFHPSAVSSL